MRAFRRRQKNIFFYEFLFSKIDHFSSNFCPSCNVWTFQLLIVLVYVTSPQCQGFLSILQLISVTIIMLLLKKSPWDNKVLRRFWEEIFSQKVISFYDRFFLKRMKVLRKVWHLVKSDASSFLCENCPKKVGIYAVSLHSCFC